jgi:hypothetical protein
MRIPGLFVSGMVKLSSLAVFGVAAVSAGLPLYIGCYNDNVPGRDLTTWFCSNGKVGRDCAIDENMPYPRNWAGSAKMSPEFCSDLCSGFRFFGLQAGFGCFCGNDYGNNGGKAQDGECDMPCSGSPSIMCGSGQHNSIYAVNTTTTA